MANTFSQLFVHVIFTVKGRANLIHESFREKVEKYIAGIVSNKKQKLYAIYCMPDHVHILISISPSATISDLVRDIKSASSSFISLNKWVVGKFSWQEGFGAFSYSKSQVDKVVNYIIKQPEHHKHQSFKDEYLELLRRFDVSYNEEYLFDWVES
ncbi:IS200/IS605 family transposase [Solitalea canadensis]|uniref:Transposase n=1 Tax=Solitalea canadensis (strain ATCC 29591 / DSM 3403 / JCM 21819 / LMG 8368 / NBRC 15130 / NCIMB 12057 / USAM 9D) TaxID=929556 RepID=H8KN70_SOLCM|nr:IS200/IS605 family transposase [Solitalea canadensis]AFD09403.1 transposase [Solitalea canadensis DSM 3403]